MDKRFLEKSRNHIAKAREHRSEGIKGLNKCIRLLSKAISTISDVYNKENEDERNVLAEAYCLRALCSQEQQKSEFNLLEDLRHALNLWLGPEHSGSVVNTVDHNTLILLCHVADLLSLKGHMDLHPDIYELITSCRHYKNYPALLWQAKRLSHALCTSPVNDAFVLTYSKKWKHINSVKRWERRMDEAAEPLKVGFQQCCSVLSTRSSATNHSHLTVDAIKKAASDLTINVPGSNMALYHSSNMYYDLSETMFCNGSMIEALLHARTALKMRKRLFDKAFTYKMGRHNDIRNFQLRPVAATRAWPNDKGSTDSFALTPWSVLRCYLESLLQVGTIQETVGDVVGEAEAILLLGKRISSLQDLPVFVVSFSTILGKIYCKQQRWELAEQELHSAKVILAERSNLMSCEKCKLILGVKVEQQFGDLYRSHSNQLAKAESSYRSAVNLLEQPVWKNCVSDPNETVSRNRVFCDIDGHAEEQEPQVTRKACGCKITCVKDEVNCWHCVPSGVVNSSSLKSVIDLKWECNRRRLLVKSWIGIGEFFLARGKVKYAHKALMRSIYVLANRSTFQSSNSKISFPLLSELVQKNIIGDMFTVEHATLIYTICWMSLRSTCDEDRRNHAFEFFNISIPAIVSGLKISLIGCCEIPEVFQKVSRLLAVLYTLSTSCNTFSIPASSNSLSVSQWASFFHQASLGATFNSKLFSRHLMKHIDENTVEVNGPSSSSSTSLWLHRLVSKSDADLEEYVLNFFQGLPRATIICVSILGEDYASWLSNVSHWKFNNPWILVSRLNSNCAPIVIALPIASILAGNPTREDKESSVEEGHFPWGHTIVDQVAPLFRSLLEELYDIKTTGEWRRIALKLDARVRDFLRDMEEAMFGPWKELLRGGLLDHKDLGGLQKKLKNELKSKVDIDVHRDIIQALTRCGVQRVESEKRKKLRKGNKRTIDVTRQRVNCLLNLIIRNGRYIGERECIDDGSKVSDYLLNTITIGDGGYVDREPIILVLDLDIQMLPWESFPVFRDQEVYRMPSVASISYTCDKNSRSQQKNGEEFPEIDPLNAYYLVDPSHDLESAAEAGVWIRQQIKQKKIKNELKGVDVHKGIIQAIRRCGVQRVEKEKRKKLRKGNKRKVDETRRRVACLSNLIMGNGCYIGERECVDDGSKVSDYLLNTITIEDGVYVDREPIILVLDLDIQMLPWESFPVFRDQEVYRMPSVASISYTCDKNSRSQQKNGEEFPEIDPLNAYYLVDPSHDLESAAEAGVWIKQQIKQGTIGISPGVAELSRVLEEYHLFIYLGHGSGCQYISDKKIMSLERCAAVLLMGCSSGSLPLSGPYLPVKVPLSCLLAGSPVIVANLWDVGGDITVFIKEVLDGWIKARSGNCVLCTQQLSAAQNSKRKRSSKSGEVKLDCKHRIGSFVSEARKKCELPYVVGAAPICYGVPTNIARDDL